MKLIGEITGLPRCGAAGIDVGATKTHIRFVAPGALEPQELALRTGEYDSLEELLCAAFLEAGCLPSRVVAGVAGLPDVNGDIAVTNQKTWPIFRRDDFVRKSNVELRIVNDIFPALAGVDWLESDGLVSMTPDVPLPKTTAKLVGSLGSGFGAAFMDPAGGFHSTETGHITWQPVTDMEHDFLKFLHLRRPRVIVTMEEAIGGLFGFDRLYEFVSPLVKPGSVVENEVEALRADKKPIGPAISIGALAGDECCMTVMELFGSILGQSLRNIALGALVEEGGAIYLAGSVLQANKGAELLMEKTSFRERFVSPGAQHDEFLATIPFYLITDGHVAVKGAYGLASLAAHVGA